MRTATLLCRRPVARTGDCTSGRPRGDEEENGTGRDDRDAYSRIPGVKLESPEKEPAGKEHRRPSQCPGDQTSFTVGDRRQAQGRSECDVNQSEQRPVRVRERPHQTPGFVTGVEVRADFEPVKQLQDEPQAAEDEYRPPADEDMTTDVGPGYSRVDCIGAQWSGSRLALYVLGEDRRPLTSTFPRAIDSASLTATRSRR